MKKAETIAPLLNPLRLISVDGIAFCQLLTVSTNFFISSWVWIPTLMTTGDGRENKKNPHDGGCGEENVTIPKQKK
jgi:hypothetical protein